MKDEEVKFYEDKALNRVNLHRDPVFIPNAFPLAMYDHQKCTTTKVQVLVKHDILTCLPRHKKYSSNLWNCQRLYIRCACEQNATYGYKGTMLWFDHAIWFMVNNLKRFFDSTHGPSLAGKYGAFITWINGAAQTIVQAQITFMSTRRLMGGGYCVSVERGAGSRDFLWRPWRRRPITVDHEIVDFLNSWI
jgi:hypothetical protein